MASCGTITVVPAFDESSVTASCSVGSQEITPGGTVDVPVTVTNSNDGPASYTVDVLVDGSTETTLSGTVPGGDQAADSVTLAFDDTGQYGIDVSVSASPA